MKHSHGKRKKKKESKDRDNSSSEINSSFLTLEQCYRESSVQISDRVLSNDVSESLDSTLSEDSSSDSESSTSSESSMSNYGHSIKPLRDNEVKEPDDTLLVNILPVNASLSSIRTIDNDTTIKPDDRIVIIRSKSPVKIFLPDYPINSSNISSETIFNGRYLIVKNKNNNVDSYILSSNNTINELKSYTLHGKERVDLVYNGSIWITI